MGNEESQQGGAPGQQQQGAPGTFGAMMGVAPQQQQQPRFGGGPPPAMRQVAPTGRPNLRPGGPGPPRGAFPGGPGTVPPRQQGGGPVRPVQVGVQPWAEPPVQQPPQFRGPGAPQATPLRPPLQQQQQQQQAAAAAAKAKQQQQMIEAEMDYGVDLSNLSEEEKAKILSVMARAQDLDQDYERHKRAKEEPAEVRQLLCPLCQAVDLAVETNKMCGDCGKNFCQKCGTFVPGEGRRSVWVCNTCSNRRKQQSAAKASQQQDTATYTTAGQQVAGVDSSGRKDETIVSREYHHDSPSLSSGREEEDYYVELEEDEDDDGWGGFGSSGDDDDHDGFGDRASSIRRMMLEEDSDEEEEDEEGGGRGGGGGGALPFYDRSPGEVYTIPEEDDEEAASPSPAWDGGQLNTDTASSLLRWRGMGQPFQNAQQQQQQMHHQAGMMQQPGHQQQAVTTAVMQQPSVSLLGSGVGSGSLLSGSLIPSSAVGRGTLPRTVPLTAVSQQQQQWPNSQATVQQANQQQQNQWGMQQTPLMTAQQQQQPIQQKQQQLQPKGMDVVPGMQQHQPMQAGLTMKKGVVESSDWSPVTDLSPILDVSPSLEAAEQELMEKCALQEQQQQVRPGGIPRAQSGTISSLLADFNKSVGQTTPTLDDGHQQQRSLAGVGMTQHQQQQHQQQHQQQTSSSTAVQKTGALTGGTEMDQNQNLVQQHQFQLQQQQLMIQQQQQVIQQQQQQLQHQMHQQQMQSQQIQTQQQIQQDIQQQQQQPQTMTVQQQQAGVVMGGTPMQQQTPSQRKVHRRLPQPTVDQMQAAVALAAQTPRSKSQPPNRGGIGVGTPSSFQRPVSPIMAPRNTFESSSASSSLLGIVQSSQGLMTPSMLNTSAISPSPRKDPDATSSLEGDGGKKVRRRLPPVPLDQEPTTVPLRRTKDRNRTLSMPLSTSADRGAWDTRRMPQRTTSLDDGMSLTKATGSILDTLGLTSSSTDTYLRLLAARDLAGLLGTTTITTTTTTTSVLDSIPSSIGLSTSLLGRRDLSAPHSLSLYRDVIPSSTSASYLLDSGSLDPGPKLPSYIMSLKQQLREELRSVSDHSRRRITDPDLSGLLSHSTWPQDSSATYKMGGTGGSRMAAGSAAARRSRHRRHASDTKLSMFTSLGREDLVDDPLSRYKLYQGGSTMPFKSYEFESIDDHLGPSYGYRANRSTYPRRSSLTDMRSAVADELRDTAVTSLASSKDPALRRYNRELARLRRHTDTGLDRLSLSTGLDPYGRGFRGGGRTAPRSWHPSPYVSEDEDEREEKKAKIKAEIARRRQHLEESGRLHHHEDPMYKISRISGQRDHHAGYSSPLWSGDRLYTSPISLDSSSQDSGQEELLMMRRDAYRNPNYMSSTYPAYRNSSSRYVDGGGGRYGYGDPYYGNEYRDDLAGDPYGDLYSPGLDSEGSELAPMPLLPDMPTRSRRLLHDLGSTPLGPRQQHHHHRSGMSSQQPYDEYDQGRRGGVEDRRPPHNPDQRKAQNTKASQKYDFPVKRILLTRDPKDRSVSGNGLGMKVVGGKEIPGSNGMIGAYVARIYPGGVAETLGEVREGDQVLEWNGTSLTGKTYEEVQRIIATSGDEVEIVIRCDFNMLSSRSSSQHHHNRHHHHEQQNHHQESRLSRSGGHPHNHHQGSRSGGSTNSYQQQHHHQQQQQSSYRTTTAAARGYNYNGGTPTEEGIHNSNCVDVERCGSASPSRGYRSSPTRHQRIGSPTGKADTTDNKEKYRAEDISGEIQLQVCYDSKASILYVTIVRARNLVTSRDNSGLPDPYVKCYLLPDRRVENQRRTRYFSRCSNPEWKQTMVYPQVPQDQLKKKHLEISVWNYDVNRPPEFLGEVILDLKDTSVIDEQSRWYKLHPHDPKKYPSQSLNNEGAIKMARLNNPNKNNSLYLDNDDIRKNNNLEKKFFKQLTKKSNVNDSYTRVSSQSWRVPSLYTGNITAHPLLPQGCHGAVCTIL